MHQVSIRPQWSIRQVGGVAIPEKVIALLVQVGDGGSLLHACKTMEISYRHAWELIRQAEASLGVSLLVMERGRGSTLTPIAQKLVWADRRIRARLSPMLDSLASELMAEIEQVLFPTPDLLRIHASHGFAIEALHGMLGSAGVPIERRYCPSLEALASLKNGQCEVASFHAPIGEFEQTVLGHYQGVLQPQSQTLIHVASRRMGLITAPGNPKSIYSFDDLVRPDVRFVNRQEGSATRFLIDLLLAKNRIDPRQVNGYAYCEDTHAAVAAFVASGKADVTYGVETPARQFKLHFIPSQTENYSLICDTKTLKAPLMQKLLAVLRSDAFKAAVDKLPGYASQHAGLATDLSSAFGGLLRGSVGGPIVDR